MLAEHQRERATQAERSARMQQRLAEAAFNIIRDGGYVNFRTSAVSREAGVSQGAQLHHYPTKGSLATAALEYAYGKAGEKFELNCARTAGGEDLLDIILQDFMDFYLSDYFAVALDILMAGGKEEELRSDLVRMTRAFRGRVERFWLEKLVDDGWSLTLAEDVLALSHSIVRGFATRALVMDDNAEFQRLLRRWRSIVGALRDQ